MFHLSVLVRKHYLSAPVVVICYCCTNV